MLCLSKTRKSKNLLRARRRIYPNVADLLPAKTAKLAPVHAVCARARLGQDLTYGEVRFDLSETARGHIWHTLARFSSAQVCNVRVNSLFSNLPAFFH